MVELDDTDLSILQLLAEDSRRPYSEIADKVGVSPPTVSDRVDRLEELGVIEQFTLDIDRSTLSDGVGVLVDLQLRPGATEEVMARLAGVEHVEHVFATADAHVVAKATVREQEIRLLLSEAIDLDDVIEYEVRLLTGSAWNPQVDSTDFAFTCDECGNRVTNEGESVRIDGQLHHFCCRTCRESFEDELERLQQSA